jgi:hypothetical protein
MIPIFPKFKNLSRNDRDEIIAHTRDFLPYSDFNFNSLWSWDTTGEMKFSDLNGNLVVLLPDYLSGKPVISYLGVKKPQKTVEALLDYASKKDLGHLTLVPEVAVSRLPERLFNVSEERDNFDYIYSTKQLAKLQGKSFKVKRHLSNRFAKEHPEAKFITAPLSQPDSYREVLQVLAEWTEKKAKDDTVMENKAIRRILKLAKLDENELILSGVYIQTELLAFSIDEVLTNGYAISHFYKVKSEHKGISEYLNCKTAAHLFKQGVEFWSWEQDLGIEGLRKSKMSYRPVQFLKKFSVSYKE